jgi:ubiquinone/menaquinone biosynthesis C-methylase UbiE
MDDKTFDNQADAQDWASLIEAPNQPREKDIYPRLKTWTETGTDILDVGCGQGACSAQIDLNGRRYTGVEPSPFLRARAIEIHSSPERRFIHGNAYQLPLADASFDSVFSIAVWHLLGDIRRAAAEMARVLKPGGRFLIITANPEAYDLWAAPYTHRKQMGRRLEGQVKEKDKVLSQDVLYLHTLEELEEALAGAQLLPTESETFRTADDTDLYLLIEGTKE